MSHVAPHSVFIPWQIMLIVLGALIAVPIVILIGTLVLDRLPFWLIRRQARHTRRRS